MEKITIALFTYNSEEFIDESIKAILDFSEACNILIVDDYSTDNTNIKIENFLSGLSFENQKRIEYHRNNVNIGTVKQFLNAANLCKTKYIKPIDCADKFLSHNFQLIVDTFKKNNSDVIFTKPAFIESGIVFEDKFKENLLKKTLALSSKRRVLSLYTVNNLIAPTAFFRTEFIKKAIPNIGQIKLIEDWPLWIYGSYIGSKFDYVDEKFIGYRIHPNQSSRSIELKQVLDQDLIEIDRLKESLLPWKIGGFGPFLFKIQSKILNKLIAYV